MPEIQIGERVPSFSLPDQDGNVFNLDEALGKGPLVFFFYPKDETPGCTIEACSFRDNNGALVEAGANVFGISSDSVASHKRFVDKHSLNYRLLADEQGKVRDAFGVPRGMFGLAPGRVTYVVDDKGILRHRFEASLRVTKHVDEALETVRKLAAEQRA